MGRVFIWHTFGDGSIRGLQKLCQVEKNLPLVVAADPAILNSTAGGQESLHTSIGIWHSLISLQNLRETHMHFTLFKSN